MTSNKLEYDAAVGGHVAIPEVIRTFNYASERISEIRKMMNAIQNPSTTKLAFQTLPKHMLRRAMSHHPKRLPRRYRNIHESQMSKSGNPQTTKRPSRKFRRKPSNLLMEYARRQREHVWLETHVWHAKRFHMAARWGYKLPVASCAKTFRASYRATAQHCLLQDVSFVGCLAVKGPLEHLRRGFDRITSRRCGLGITAKIYVEGKREGRVTIFKADQYPKAAFGEVNFIWRPEEDSTEESKEVWLFVHPSVYQDIRDELITVFNLSSDQTQVVEEVEEEQARTVTKTAAFTRCPSYSNSSTKICVSELKDTLNRFRLTGPLSHSVLVSALKCKALRPTEPNNWFKEYQKDEKSRNAHLMQSEFWSKCKGLTSAGMLTPNMVLGLTIEDPRLNRPEKRAKAVPAVSDIDKSVIRELPYELCRSAIWDANLRTEITKSMMSTHEISQRRSADAIVPGERCRFEDDIQPVPVLLIQRPGSQNNTYKKLGYASGWDVIAPSGCGMNIWLSLIMWGARPGGLREMNSISREAGVDAHLPDTLVARRNQAEKQHELKTRYFRLPPNKRTNYRKLGVASPFNCPFVKLLNEWKSAASRPIEHFHVIREQQQLQEISMALRQNRQMPSMPEDCLVPVYLKIKGRGNPGDFSLICLPKSSDLKHALKQQKYFDKKPVYVEPLHEDTNENIRKKLRKSHKILLKRLRNRRVREKRRKQEGSEKRIKIRPPNTSALIAEQLKKMCALWLPDVKSSIRNQCSREVFGYVTESSFSFTEAAVMAIGYATVAGLRQLMTVGKGRGDRVVFIRGTKTRNYRFASIKINCL